MDLVSVRNTHPLITKQSLSNVNETKQNQTKKEKTKLVKKPYQSPNHMYFNFYTESTYYQFYQLGPSSNTFPVLKQLETTPNTGDRLIFYNWTQFPPSQTPKFPLLYPTQHVQDYMYNQSIKSGLNLPQIV